MDTESIFTEEPEKELWRQIKHFTFEQNLRKYFASNNIPVTNNSVIDYIAGSFSQAYDFFNSSKYVSLQTLPLILYYGTINLFFGLIALIIGDIPVINNHGMSLPTPNNINSLSELKIKLRWNGNSCLSYLKDIFINYNNNITLLSDINLSIPLSLIPDLYNLYINCYNLPPSLLPVDIFEDDDGFIDRINNDLVNSIGGFDSVKKLIPFYKTDYIYTSIFNPMKYVVLRKKQNSLDHAVYTIDGKKYINLFIAHDNNYIHIPTELSFLFILFALCSINRYHPNIWNKFVLYDSTGEKLLFERFFDISKRIIPNLILTRILNKNIHFHSMMYNVKKIDVKHIDIDIDTSILCRPENPES